LQEYSNHLPLLRSKERGGERRRKRPNSIGSGDFQEEDRKGTTVFVSKRIRRCQNHASQKIVGGTPAGPAYGRSGIRHTGGLSLEEALEHENLGVDANGEVTSGWNHEGESTDAMLRDGLLVVVMKRSNVRWSEAGRLSTSEP